MAELAVLDTSVAIAWFFTDEPLRDRSLDVRESCIEHPERFVVPHLFMSEMLNGIARKSGREHPFVTSALYVLERLGLRSLSLSHEAILHAAHWTCRGLSGYDATFVGLAQDLGCRWLTADDRAATLVGNRLARSLRSWKP